MPKTDEITVEENMEFLAECDKLEKLIDQFAEQMYLKLVDKARRHWRKWDDPASFPYLIDQLKEHVQKNPSIKNLIDIGNLAAFLWWQMRERSFEKGENLIFPDDRR